ncbi:hypothetical protein [Bradyrhizobium sp. AZCC 2289]|uniref:hypothetical protein n=1 Tax=Bradyrhizobium sp. AZCC 2289 TaxID=3117026 RepID=UPI002FEE7061
MPPSKTTKSSTAVADGDQQLPVIADRDLPIAPDLFPGEQISDTELVQHYARLIGPRWQRQTDTILAIAKDCAEANAKIPGRLRKSFYEQAKISAEVFRKLAGIGHSHALHNPDIAAALPPNYSILYIAKNMSAVELDRAIAAGIINPNSSRKKVEEWVADPKNCRYRAKHEPDEIALAKMEGRAKEVKVLLNLWNDSPELARRFRQSMGVVKEAFFKEICKQKLG